MLHSTIQIAVFASGRGGNFDAIHASIAPLARIVALVCDQPKAAVVEKARGLGIPIIVEPVPENSAGESAQDVRNRHEAAILEKLRPFAPRFAILAGYMRILGPAMLNAFGSERGYFRVTNIHPSLLPAFAGIGSYAKAFRFGAKVTGVTVHLADAGLDSGPICAQEAFSISECGSESEVEKKGLEIEHRLYPDTLKWVLPENFTLETRNGRLCVRKN